MHKIKRIFVVDDESDTCLTLTTVLEDNGFVVHAFNDSFLALENFRKDLYDVLILDIKMQKMNGLELYKEIKKIDNKVKICFLTAGDYGSFIDVFSDLKENQFIQKPIANEELIKIVNGIISST
jgi:two-component system, OmpR family, response regulator ChvI